MSAIDVLFATEVIAYEFLSEIRRQTDFLLWDVQVRKEVVAYELLSEIRRQTDFLLWDAEVQHGNYGADVRQRQRGMGSGTVHGVGRLDVRRRRSG